MSRASTGQRQLALVMHWKSNQLADTNSWQRPQTELGSSDGRWGHCASNLKEQPSPPLPKMMFSCERRICLTDNGGLCLRPILGRDQPIQFLGFDLILHLTFCPTNC